jgi:hypothetical protein
MIDELQKREKQHSDMVAQSEAYHASCAELVSKLNFANQDLDTPFSAIGSLHLIERASIMEE